MTGRVVVVVGASSGIGLAAAIAFAARHDDLVLVSRSADALEAAKTACRSAGAGEVDVVVDDIRDPAAADRVVARTLDRHGRIDVVVHTATVMGYGTVEAMPAEVFTAVVDTAVHGTVHLSRAVLPVLRRQHAGVFIGVNSLLGSVTVPQMGAYAASKWGQRAVLRTLQQETRDEPGVHVCIVSPGSINTPIYYQAANYTGQAARPPWPVLSPERAGAAIVRLADRPRRHVSVPVGPGNPLIIAGFRLLPLLYDRLVGPLFRLAALTRKSLEPAAGNVHEPVPGQERVHGRWPQPR
ncbi:SDR family NAD(P)-dependent oxidoreductase [Umezawaea sp. Da 62-37]|uniref:SDR family NAD(P)-dependent oxidoreductase n=1 Tax=Umezawaea sp. Da 62-37 TaxID=3075927 RepID=UPI0028F6D420|nr:SDR family NAD(P)-dependent oxidoreductase [Umezawaea sp. Da 62-37]WNV87506.1 SDR family NAD(P)-dependent oxidoreductase [Umezawaea sp. Da 62-37]